LPFLVKIFALFASFLPEKEKADKSLTKVVIMQHHLSLLLKINLQIFDIKI